MRMIMATAAMEFVETRTEPEALLLEANLIKRLRPRFNVLLRDDKSFPYILISGDHEAPPSSNTVVRARAKATISAHCIRWRSQRHHQRHAKAFLIRNCSDSYYSNRSRPCLLYQIKRCAGPLHR